MEPKVKAVTIADVMTVMKKKSPRRWQRLIEARVQRAVAGFQIPMLAIPDLYKQLAAAAESQSDDELENLVADYPGVQKF